MENFETHSHDVLVIGAGGAGLRAAIESSAKGRSSADIFAGRKNAQQLENAF